MIGKPTELYEKFAVAFALIRRQRQNARYVVIFCRLFLLNVTDNFT